MTLWMQHTMEAKLCAASSLIYLGLTVPLFILANTLNFNSGNDLINDYDWPVPARCTGNILQ